MPSIAPVTIANRAPALPTPPSAPLLDAGEAPELVAQDAEIPTTIRASRAAMQNHGQSGYGPSRVRTPRSDPYALPVVPQSSTADIIEKFDLELELGRVIDDDITTPEHAEANAERAQLLEHCHVQNRKLQIAEQRVVEMQLAAA